MLPFANSVNYRYMARKVVVLTLKLGLFTLNYTQNTNKLISRALFFFFFFFKPAPSANCNLSDGGGASQRGGFTGAL